MRFMRENSENEEKLTRLIKKDPNVLKKLISLDKMEEFKNYLESNNIYFENSELKKLYLVFQYFNKSVPDDDLGVSGGAMGIGKDLFNCLNNINNDNSSNNF